MAFIFRHGDTPWLECQRLVWFRMGNGLLGVALDSATTVVQRTRFGKDIALSVRAA